MPFEAMVPERRELALTMAGSAAMSLIVGELETLTENGPVVLRSSPSTSGPDLESTPAPLFPTARDPIADAIAAARANPRQAYRKRDLARLSALLMPVFAGLLLMFSLWIWPAIGLSLR